MSLWTAYSQEQQQSSVSRVLVQEMITSILETPGVIDTPFTFKKIYGEHVLIHLEQTRCITFVH